ncbi:MAG: hypothetical protein RJA25_405 [Bacteroidota bacterium]|jgi:hypothetical protein
MKKFSLFLLLLSSLQRIFADIPIEESNKFSGFNHVNLLPWVLLIVLSIGGFIFFNGVKKNKK